jgi:hypothetical protein
MSREALSRGFVALMGELYDSRAYFDRVDDLYGKGRIVIDKGWRGYAASHPFARRRHEARLWFEAFGLMARLATKIPDADLRKTYLKRFWAFVRARPEPAVARVYALKCAVHWHMHQFVRILAARDRPPINTY